MDITRGTTGIQLAYTIGLVSVIVGLVRGRASWERLLLSPALALPLTLLAALVIAMTSFLLDAFGLVGHLLRIPYGICITATMGYMAGRALAGAGGPLPVHRRGTLVGGLPQRQTEPEPEAAPAARRIGGPATLAGVPIPLQDETKHFKLIGTTGTGKSTAIRELLYAALLRGDRAIIADPDGAYLAHFYDLSRGDVILNPFRGEARKWDLFAEVRETQDIEQLAAALIPDSGDGERVWSDYARTFLSELIQQGVLSGERSDRELFRLVTGAPTEELRALLGGTAAGPFLEAGNERMFGSVRSVASSSLRALEYTIRQRAQPFSVRQWVRGASLAPSAGRALFLPYKAGEIAALRTVISAWMRLAIIEAMDQDEGDQRLWFVVDELDALGAIDGLKDALARLRKFGGRCVLGFQSIAQVSGTYGEAAAETIVENCGNTLILRCSASEHGGTAQFASRLIGDREVMEPIISRTRHPGHWILTSRTTTEHVKIEPAVLASEIEQLPDLEGFLKLASLPAWQYVRLPLAGGAPPAPWRPGGAPPSAPALRTVR